MDDVCSVPGEAVTSRRAILQFITVVAEVVFDFSASDFDTGTRGLSRFIGTEVSGSASGVRGVSVLVNKAFCTENLDPRVSSTITTLS